MTSYISTEHKVGQYQWDFHVIILGNISPVLRYYIVLIYSLVINANVCVASIEILMQKNRAIKVI